MAPSVRWLASTEEGEEGSVTSFRIGADGDAYVAEWVGVARLVATRGGEDARLTFEPDAPESVREKIRSGSAMLLLRQLRGQMALHGAAVHRGGRALVLLGPSGAGKSTLAHALVRDHGFELLADDAVALDGAPPAYTVLPTERRVWLADDGAARKVAVPVPAAQAAWAPANLEAFVALSFGGDDVTLSPRAPLASAADLVAGFVRFALEDRALLEREAQRITELVTRVPFVELVRPRDPLRMGDAARALAGWMR